MGYCSHPQEKTTVLMQPCIQELSEFFLNKLVHSGWAAPLGHWYQLGYLLQLINKLEYIRVVGLIWDVRCGFSMSRLLYLL